MSNKRKIMVILCLLCIGIILVLIYMNRKIENENIDYTDNEIPVETIEEMEKYSGKIKNIPSITEYNTIRTCISKFYTYYAMLYDEDIINRENEYGLEYYKEVVYSFLNEDYIQRNGITADNIDSKFVEIEDSKVEIYTVYYLTEYDFETVNSSNIQVYFTKGLLRNSSNSSDTKEFSVIVYLDTENMTFELDLDNTLGIDFDELYDSQEVEFELPESVANRKINIFSYTTTSYEDIATILFNNTIKLMVYNTDKAYELLTDEAKSVYKSESELATYVENNKKKLLLSSFKIYEIDYEDTVFVLNVYDSSSNYEFRFYFENGFSTYRYEFSEI